MKLQFLGSGSAFVPLKDNFQSNMILKNDNGKKLLIDCGTDARHSMDEAGLSYHDVDSVYISHFHADHVGGLEWLAFSTYFDPTYHGKPGLILHPSMVNSIWDNLLSGGLSSLKGSRTAVLEDYFTVNPHTEKTFFIWENITFYFIKTTHAHNGSCLMPSYGVFFKANNKMVLLTTDTQFTPDVFQEYYVKADLIFHDCTTTEHKCEVHAHFEELATLPDTIKNKMWLYHYSDLHRFDAKANGFKGFVKKGQEFDL